MNADLWDLEDVGAGPRQVRVYMAVACGPACPEAFAARCANSRAIWQGATL